MKKQVVAVKKVTIGGAATVQTSPALTNAGGVSVKVIVRCRPFIEREIRNGEDRHAAVEIDKDLRQVSLLKDSKHDKQVKEQYKTFRFDEIFDETSKQQEVYASAAFQLVEDSFKGYNGTVFAYGQTGCGKTHTMVGNLQVGEMKGIMPNVFDHVFNIVNTSIARRQSEGLSHDLQVLIRCQFVEIYNEEIHDLLCKFLLRR